jgi:hypothetical protein
VNALKALIVFGFMGAAGAWAEPFPVQGLEFNPKLKVRISSLNPSANGGFLLAATAGEFEIAIKGTPMKSQIAAAEMAKVEMVNIKNLYSPRGSPYAGQISEVIECEKAFKPETAALKILDKPVVALLGGTNARKLFGACTHDQVTFMAEYFTFYDTAGAREIDVRIFKKLNTAKPREFVTRLREFGAKLFADKVP